MIYNGYPIIERPPAAPLTETLTWASDTRKSNSGREERIALRGRPRMTLRMEFPIEDDLVTEFNSLISVKWNKWLIPMWHLAKRLTNPSGNIITLASNDEITDRGFFSAPYALLQNYLYTHVTAITINNNMIHLTTPPDWTKTFIKEAQNWSIMPIHFGQVINKRGFEGTGYDDLMEIIYDVDDPPVPSEGTPPLQITGTDGNQIEVLTVSSQDNIKQEDQEQEDKLDFQLGKREIIKDWTRPEKISNYNRVIWLDGIDTNYTATDWKNYADDAIEFRKFLHRREGRTIAFLEPSFRRDMEVTAISTNSISVTVKPSASDEIQKLINENPFLCLRLKNGSMAAVNITDTNITISNNAVTLTTMPATTVTLDEILYCSLATISRLTKDEVQFVWDGNETATCSIRFTATNPTREAAGNGVVTFISHYYIGESEFRTNQGTPTPPSQPSGFGYGFGEDWGS